MPLPRTQLSLVGVGGVAGASLRWLVNQSVDVGAFPWHTLIVNVLGCVGLAVVTSRATSATLRRFLGVGFFGGLTTFSTFSIEIVELLDQGREVTAVSYLVASLVLGLAAFVATRQLVMNPASRP